MLKHKLLSPVFIACLTLGGCTQAVTTYDQSKSFSQSTAGTTSNPDIYDDEDEQAPAPSPTPTPSPSPTPTPSPSPTPTPSPSPTPTATPSPTPTATPSPTPTPSPSPTPTPSPSASPSPVVMETCDDDGDLLLETQFKCHTDAHAGADNAQCVKKFDLNDKKITLTAHFAVASLNVASYECARVYQNSTLAKVAALENSNGQYFFNGRITYCFKAGTLDLEDDAGKNDLKQLVLERFLLALTEKASPKVKEAFAQRDGSGSRLKALDVITTQVENGKPVHPPIDLSKIAGPELEKAYCLRDAEEAD